MNALENMRTALEEFAYIEARDPHGLDTANAGIALAMAVGDYLAALERGREQ